MKSFGFFSLRLLAVLSCLALGATLASAQTNLPGAQVGVAYSYTITTTPAAPAGTVYSATGLPTGLSINSSTGQISGTPTAAGTYTGTVSLALDSVTNNLNYSLVVTAAVGAPAITSATTAAATVGVAFEYEVTASNAPTSYNVGTLPAGLSFDSGTHTIAGTPTSAGTYAISLSANNASGTGATATLTLTVSPAGPVPVVSSAATASATATGTPSEFTVSYQIEASESPASFSATGLPLGISVNATTGAISGTTTIQGVYTVGLSATNNNGTGPTKNLTLTVGAVSEITSAATLNLTVNQAMPAFTINASNSPGSFDIAGLPPGLSANATTGVITGTPTATGVSAVTISANNAVGTGPAATLTITVAAASGGGGGGGGGGGDVAVPSITSATTATAVLNEPFAFAVTTSPAATLFAASGLPAGVAINASTGAISGTFAAVGTHTVTITASNGNGSGFGLLTITVNARPVVTAQPQGGAVAIGGSATLSVTASGTPAPTYQWHRNGVAIVGAVGPTLVLSDFQPDDAGAYTVALTNVTGTINSQAAVLGVVSMAKVAGSGEVVGEDIVHPNGNIYDQILLTGTAATITADANKVTRISFIDLSDDIVQVEFSGAGTVTLTLENASDAAAPVKYNQPDVTYMKGHASLVLTGADVSSHLSVFTVGTITAVNQSLFKEGETYDGVADIGLVSIASIDGKFGGIRTANAGYFRTSGFTGIHAPGVAVQGAVYVGDLTAADEATAVLIFESTTDVRVTGGSLLQPNERAVQVDGITAVKFTDGQTSHGTLLPAQENQAVFEQDGVDVTAEIVVTN